MADRDSFQPHPALVRNTGYLLSRVGALCQRHFAAQMAALGLTPRMWGALNVLDHEGPLSQHGLGRCVGMDPSSMVSTIDELEGQGLVERRRDPSDRRAYALHITESGHETLARGRTIARAAQEELFGDLSAAERDQLRELLLRIGANPALAGPS